MYEEHSLFLFSTQRKRANASQNAEGKHSSNSVRVKGADQREAVCSSGLRGNSPPPPPPPPTPRRESSKRNKPEVPICWVLFNRRVSALRLYPECRRARASKQNYLRMVTYSLSVFRHAWRRQALCLCYAQLVFDVSVGGWSPGDMCSIHRFNLGDFLSLLPSFFFPTSKSSSEWKKLVKLRYISNSLSLRR